MNTNAFYRFLTVIGVIVTLFLVSCGAPKLKQTNQNDVVEVTKPDGPEGLMAELPKTISSSPVNFTSKEKVKAMMEFMSSDDLGGRDTGSEGIELAAKYIEGQFKGSGVMNYFDSYRDTLSNFKKPAFNVVGWVPGSDPVLRDQFVIVGAHYDHIGFIDPENGDNIANGANDNASGTTAVLEMARYFGTQKTNKRSLLFVLFSAEEKGLLGSKHLAKKLKDRQMDIYTVLNFEMIGVPMNGKDYEVYITGYAKSNLAEVSNKYAGNGFVGKLPTAGSYGLFQRSDNYPFYQEMNIPAHTYCTFDFQNFGHYHKVGDEVGLMDFNHMTSMINKLIPVVEGISNSKDREVKLY